MADNPTLEIEAAPVRRKGVKRRAFLIGGAALAGAGIFALWWGERSAGQRALDLTGKPKSGSFTGWIRIDADDSVTLFTPHIDMGTGTSTALGQMVIDELDGDWAKLKVEAAPADAAFANTVLGRGFLADISGAPGVINAMPNGLWGYIARSLPLQITGGSSAVRFTGNLGFRKLAAAARLALIEEAAERLKVSAGELTTQGGKVTHTKSGRVLRYGELAEGASRRSLTATPALKAKNAQRLIGKPVPRIDIPAKVEGTAQYGIDVIRPDMRIATIMAAPVRGGKLESVDPAPAMAVKGVEKVIKLDDAVAVVGKGYWAAIQGLRALSPKFSDGGKSGVTSETIHAEQLKLVQDDASGFSAKGGKPIKASYRTPYLHHAMMEPFALTAHFHDGKLDVWGGLQDPLASRAKAAKAAGLGMEDVTFHSTLLGGGFGRKLPGQVEIIPQVVKLAMELPYPVKLIWSREEEVTQGTYRPQSAVEMQAVLDPKGRITQWQSSCAQASASEGAGELLYDVADYTANSLSHESHIHTASWRSVDASQHGFYVESFVDELAAAAGQDPIAFRLANLAKDSRAARVVNAVVTAAGDGKALPKGTGRGIAVYKCFGTVCAQIVQASVKEDGYPRVEKVWAAVDCGEVINPGNAEAQVMGGIVMGLSAAIHEEITVDKGAVQQSSFPDYPLLTLAEAPEISIQFVESDAPMGGLGEPGLPPVAPALANALFAATGKRIRQLPIKAQAKV